LKATSRVISKLGSRISCYCSLPGSSSSPRLSNVTAMMPRKRYTPRRHQVMSPMALQTCIVNLNSRSQFTNTRWSSFESNVAPMMRHNCDRACSKSTPREVRRFAYIVLYVRAASTTEKTPAVMFRAARSLTSGV
jgi:hypothetical protein